MWPLSRNRDHKEFSHELTASDTRLVTSLGFLAMGAWALGCGGGGASSVPPPPPFISVSITSSASSVILGNTLSSLSRPDGHNSYRLHQRQNPPRQFTLIAGVSAGSHWIFGSQVVAIDSSTGAVAASVIGGWSCFNPGPVQFDGTYEIDRLSTGHNYTVYAEPLNGVADPSSVTPATATLCRNTTSDPGWPPLQSCVVPAMNTRFTTRTRPGS
jgi:hypothetical protein